MNARQILIVAFSMVLVLGLASCSSSWSEAELSSVESYCAVTAGDYADSCASWIDGIHRLSNCDMNQAKQVIDRIVAEYNGAPSLSIVENYEMVGCEYGAR